MAKKVVDIRNANNKLLKNSLDSLNLKFKKDRLKEEELEQNKVTEEFVMDISNN